MKAAFALCILTALAVQFATDPPTTAKLRLLAPTTAPAPNVPATQPAGLAQRIDPLAALTQELVGSWSGDPCEGTFSFNPDGTFERRHFTPGDNTITGTWSLRWDALPPTLVLTCKTSDFKKDPGREDYIGKVEALPLVELNDTAFTFVDHKYESEFERQGVAATTGQLNQIAVDYIRQNRPTWPDSHQLPVVILEAMDNWEWTRKLPQDTQGGVPVVLISKKDLKVVSAVHTQ